MKNLICFVFIFFLSSFSFAQYDEVITQSYGATPELAEENARFWASHVCRGRFYSFGVPVFHDALEVREGDSCEKNLSGFRPPYRCYDGFIAKIEYYCTPDHSSLGI